MIFYDNTGLELFGLDKNEVEGWADAFVATGKTARDFTFSGYNTSFGFLDLWETTQDELVAVLDAALKRKQLANVWADDNFV